MLQVKANHFLCQLIRIAAFTRSQFAELGFLASGRLLSIRSKAGESGQPTALFGVSNFSAERSGKRATPESFELAVALPGGLALMSRPGDIENRNWGGGDQRVDKPASAAWRHASLDTAVEISAQELCPNSFIPD